MSYLKYIRVSESSTYTITDVQSRIDTFITPWCSFFFFSKKLKKKKMYLSGQEKTTGEKKGKF